MRTSNTDRQILSYIAQFDSVDKKSILDALPNETYDTEHRLKVMAEIHRENAGNFSFPLIEEEFNYYNIGTERGAICFRLTKEGQAALVPPPKAKKYQVWQRAMRMAVSRSIRKIKK